MPAHRAATSRALCSVLLLGVAASAPALAGSYIGAPAKEIHVEGLINAPAGMSPSDISMENWDGKTVFMAFWSTNCPTCPEVIPHLNSLVKEFEGEPVEFISILKEEERDVHDFLRNQFEVNMPIALDDDMSVTRDYLVPGVPMAVVVNPQGLVVAKIHPKQITPEALRDAMAGKTPEVGLAPDPEPLRSKPSEQMSLYEISIRPSPQTADPHFSRVAGVRFTATPLRTVLARAYQVAPAYIRSETVLLDAKYDVTVIPPRGRESEAHEMLQTLLERTFDLSVEKTMQPVETLVLRMPGEEGPMLRTPAAPRTQMRVSGGMMRARNATFEQMAYALFDPLGVPVVDETGRETERFDVNFVWRKGDLDSFIAGMKKQLGVEVTRDQRETEVLIVTSGGAPASR